MALRPGLAAGMPFSVEGGYVCAEAMDVNPLRVGFQAGWSEVGGKAHTCPPSRIRRNTSEARKLQSRLEKRAFLRSHRIEKTVRSMRRQTDQSLRKRHFPTRTVGPGDFLGITQGTRCVAFAQEGLCHGCPFEYRRGDFEGKSGAKNRLAQPTLTHGKWYL